MTDPIVVVHAGAGSYDNTEETQQSIQDDLDRITTTVRDRLSNGEITAVDAVEHAVNEMEENPEYNAGYGSKLQLDGVPRPEASLMDSDGNIGCVTGLEGIEHAISVARDVKEHLPNCFIGNGFATEFAIRRGYTKKNLVTDERRVEWESLYEDLGGVGLYEKIQNLDTITDSGTVGCVVLDTDGNLCAGTSTGGRLYQFQGRIGDSPLIGAGTYCNEDIAVSCTGVGESILRVQLAKMCQVHHSAGQTLEDSVATALAEIPDEHYAGVISLTRDGEVSCQHNAETMRYSVAQ